MGARHVVWDWNGTLLDDLPLAISATAAALGDELSESLTTEHYHRHFAQPMRLLFERLLGRTISDAELSVYIARYRRAYYHHAATFRLRLGARPVLRSLTDAGITQSVLSLADHTLLRQTVSRLLIARYFRLVEGSRTLVAEGKAAALRRHLDRLSLSADQVVLVGDTAEDERAATSIGAGCVLISGGYAAKSALECTGRPVIDSLDALFPHVRPNERTSAPWSVFTAESSRPTN